MGWEEGWQESLCVIVIVYWGPYIRFYPISDVGLLFFFFNVLLKFLF